MAAHNKWEMRPLLPVTLGEQVAAAAQVWKPGQLHPDANDTDFTYAQTDFTFSPTDPPTPAAPTPAAPMDLLGSENIQLIDSGEERYQRYLQGNFGSASSGAEGFDANHDAAPAHDADHGDDADHAVLFDSHAAFVVHAGKKYRRSALTCALLLLSTAGLLGAISIANIPLTLQTFRAPHVGLREGLADGDLLKFADAAVRNAFSNKPSELRQKGELGQKGSQSGVDQDSFASLPENWVVRLMLDNAWTLAYPMALVPVLCWVPVLLGVLLIMAAAVRANRITISNKNPNERLRLRRVRRFLRCGSCLAGWGAGVGLALAFSILEVLMLGMAAFHHKEQTQLSAAVARAPVLISVMESLEAAVADDPQNKDPQIRTLVELLAELQVPPLAAVMGHDIVMTPSLLASRRAARADFMKTIDSAVGYGAAGAGFSERTFGKGGEEAGWHIQIATLAPAATNELLMNVAWLDAFVARFGGVRKMGRDWTEAAGRSPPATAQWQAALPKPVKERLFGAGTAFGAAQAGWLADGDLGRFLGWLAQNHILTGLQLDSLMQSVGAPALQAMFSLGNGDAHANAQKWTPRLRALAKGISATMFIPNGPAWGTIGLIAILFLLSCMLVMLPSASGNLALYARSQNDEGMALISLFAARNDGDPTTVTRLVRGYRTGGERRGLRRDERACRRACCKAGPGCCEMYGFFCRTGCVVCPQFCDRACCRCERCWASCEEVGEFSEEELAEEELAGDERPTLRRSERRESGRSHTEGGDSDMELEEKGVSEGAPRAEPQTRKGCARCWHGFWRKVCGRRACRQRPCCRRCRRSCGRDCYACCCFLCDRDADEGAFSEDDEDVEAETAERDDSYQWRQSNLPGRSSPQAKAPQGSEFQNQDDEFKLHKAYSTGAETAMCIVDNMAAQEEGFSEYQFSGELPFAETEASESSQEVRGQRPGFVEHLSGGC